MKLGCNVSKIVKLVETSAGTREFHFIRFQLITFIVVECKGLPIKLRNETMHWEIFFFIDSFETNLIVSKLI